MRQFEEQMNSVQFEFGNVTEFRQACIILGFIYRDISCDVHVCFVDYHKAFVIVQHVRIKAIMNTNVPLERGTIDVNAMVCLFFRRKFSTLQLKYELKLI